jgi:hypothetical protein
MSAKDLWLSLGVICLPSPTIITTKSNTMSFLKMWLIDIRIGLRKMNLRDSGDSLNLERIMRTHWSKIIVGKINEYNKSSAILYSNVY